MPNGVSTLNRLIAVAGLSGFAACALSVGGSPTGANAAPVPPPTPGQLDQISWQKFIAAVTPSGVIGKVRYETWASDQDIYVSNPCASSTGATSGCNVPTWPTSGGVQAKRFQPSVLGRSHLGLTKGFGVQAIGPNQPCGTPPGIGAGNAAANSKFPVNGCVGEEVRRDRASFDYIVQNGLWSQPSLTAFYNGPNTVAFPTDSLQVKADWIPVATLAAWLHRPASFITANFYTATANASNNTLATRYAMTSMHVSVKSPGFPDWIWADFENAYTPGRCDQTGCTDRFGAAIPSVPAKAATWQQYGACAKTVAVRNLMGVAKVAPVFANYCLTGTQTTFGTKANPTRLGSPIIEPLNADVPLNVSSCISCHAGASFNATGPAGPASALGPNAPQTGYKGYDFMWGLLAAQPSGS